MNLIKFPSEILEKIILDVIDAGGSIKTLAEVCKTFNNTINSSPKLMRKLQINFNEDKCEDFDELLAFRRSYQKIKIISNNNRDMMWFSPKFLLFLKKQKSSISEIELSGNQRFSSELIKLFKIVNGNLSKIALSIVNITIDEQFYPLNFPKLKIIESFLSYNVDSLLNLFWNVEDIKARNYKIIRKIHRNLLLYSDN